MEIVWIVFNSFPCFCDVSVWAGCIKAPKHFLSWHSTRKWPKWKRSRCWKSHNYQQLFRWKWCSWWRLIYCNSEQMKPLPLWMASPDPRAPSPHCSLHNEDLQLHLKLFKTSPAASRSSEMQQEEDQLIFIRTSHRPSPHLPQTWFSLWTHHWGRRGSHTWTAAAP